MGGNSSRNLGTPIGSWFNGKPIYPKDLEYINAGIASGKYVAIDSWGAPPQGCEYWFTLYDASGDIARHVKYAKHMSEFKNWWFSNKQHIVLAAAQSAHVSADVATQIASAALPVLLDFGVEDAKKVALGEVDPSIASAVDPVVSSLASQLGNSMQFVDNSRNAQTASSSMYGAFGMGYRGEQAAHSNDASSHRAAKVGQYEFYDHVDNFAYLGSAEKCGANFSGGYSGGCGCERGSFIGAEELDAATVINYMDSVNSKAKTQIIDDIIQAGIKLGMQITGSTQQEKIKSMLELLPSGARIKSTDDTHKKLCAALAKALNSAYGNEIINTSLEPEIICQQVAEIVSSLSAGMHSEFLAVYSDVNRILKNLHVLKDSLKDDHEAIVLRIKQSDDALLPQQLTTLNDLHGILTSEIDRQIQMLSNLLNVTLMPTEKSLAHLIKNKKELHGYIDKINVKVGSERFSKVIADILKGLGLTANFALLIERALKTVGITLDEYAKGESVQKLREKIAQGLMGKNMDESQLHEYLQAAELLYRNFYRNQDIAKTLEAHKKGSGEMDYLGGDDLYPKTVMDKRIADRKKLRNLIFNTFYRHINDLFDQLVGSIDSLTLKVGTEIPLSDQLNAFRHIIQRVDEQLVRNKNIYYALIGYYNDAMSRSKKDALLADLNMVSSYIDTIIEMPLYSSSKQYFTAVQGHVKAIVELIDKFSDEISAKFGRGEIADPICSYLEETGAADGDEKAGAYDFPDAIYGGADSIEDEPKILYKSTKNIHDALRQFDYKYRVAQIRANMSATSKELQHYSEKYEKIIANSIADILNGDKKVYEKLRAQLTDNSHFGDEDGYVLATARGFADKPAVQAERAAALKMLDAQWETKKKFWATVEAVDSYMKVFTDALIKNPQDIKDIKSMIDSIEIINDWYSEKTGNLLSGVFDYFPSRIYARADRGVTSDQTQKLIYQGVTYPPESYYSGEGSHYYQRIHDQLQTAPTPGTGSLRHAEDVILSAYPGNPNIVTIPTYGEHARLQAKKALDGLAVLKNLLSVFVHVGAKFGGEEIRKKIFMSPTQLYNNLVDYLYNSAFAQGFGVGDLKSVPESELPPEFFNSVNMAVKINMRDGEFVDRSSTVARAAWVPDITYVPGSTFVHLGVTSDGTVNVTDYRGTDDSLATALVGKINDATHRTFESLDSNAGLNIAARRLNPATRANAPAAGTIVALEPDEQVWSNGPRNNVDRILLFKKRWGVWMRSILPGLKIQEGFSFKREDEYFILILKSLAAKILTVVGMYDVLDRPMEFNGLSPIRMITGGAPETPKVDEEAVALYLRLPLLAQFYRGIFGFEGPEDPNNKFELYDDWRARPENQMIKISMVPDIDGTFAGLIRLIFRKNKFVTGSNYSEDDIKELVREVNLIHQRMRAKYPQNTVMETIHEFVAEVNRRYGVISQYERDQYEREFGYRYDYSTPGADRLNPADRYNVAPETDIAILPGEGDEEIERPSSAQKLLGETFDSSPEKKRLFTITSQHKDLVYKFRCAIDKYFENPQEEYTFNNAIRATQLKLRKEQNDEARFKLVSSLVRGTDVYSKVDGLKYILFHETVVGGLNLLSAVHSMLARFKRRVHVIDIKSIENKLWDFLMIPGTKNIIDLTLYITRYFTDDLGIADADDQQIKILILKIFGLGECLDYNGGHSTNELFSLKGGNGIDIGTAIAPFDVPRWHVGFGTLVSTGALHANFKDKTAGHHVLTCDLSRGLAGNPTQSTGLTGGLLSVIAGYSVEQLRAAYNDPQTTPANREAKAVAETFMRFIFGREHIMLELIETLFGLSSDFQGLVDVKIEDGKILINYGGLKTLISDMFESISYFMDLLRPHIKPELMNQYTDKFTPGSYYWLQEQIMEKIIDGRPAQLNALPGETKPRTGYASIDELMQKITYTYEKLTRDWKIDGANLRGTNSISSHNIVDSSRDNYDKVFAGLIFYDASKPNSGLIRSTEAPDIQAAQHSAIGGLKIVDYMHDPHESLHFAGPAGAKVLDTRFAARFYQLYSWKDEFTMNRSAMFAFNQLIAKFLQNFYDPVSGKIYSGLINQFANGSFNRAVADQNYTYPDTAPLWCVKYSAPADVKIPTTISLTAQINESLYQALYGSLKNLIKQYFEIGFAPGDYSDRRKRSATLLNVMEPPLNMTTDMVSTTGGPANNTPNLFVYLVIHAIGAIIAELFEMLDAIGTLPDAVPSNAGGSLFNDSVFLLLRTGSPTFGIGGGYASLRVIYTGNRDVSPNITQIMQKLLEGSIRDICGRIQWVVGDLNAADAAQLPFAIDDGTRPFARMFGDTQNAENQLYVNMKTKLYKYVIQFILRQPAAFQLQRDNGAIVVSAARLFPMREDALGATENDANYRAELYAAILVRLALAKLRSGDAAQYVAALTALSSEITSVRSTYLGPMTAQPKHLVKQDDLYAINTDKWLYNELYSPSADASYLLLARNTAVSNALKPGNISTVPGTANTSTNPASDTLENIQNFGRRCDPDADHVLFTSLSVIFKNLLHSRHVQTQSLVYIQDNVADIPLYMKEKMRANLPAFRNLFKVLIAKCEFLKKFMGRPELSLERSYSMVVSRETAQVSFGAAPAHNPWPYVLKAPTTSSSDTKNRFIGILDSIVRGCTSLVTSCEQTLRDVGDDPKYFETYQNSIKDYKTQYNMDPLMPLSTTLAVLKNVNSENYLDFFPIHSLGKDQFKFMYGVRSLLGNPSAKILSEHVPGFTQIVDGFNLLIDSKLQADKSKADTFLKTFVKMLRYVYELKHIKGILTPYTLLMIDAAAGANRLPVNHTQLHVDGLFVRDDLVLTDKMWAHHTTVRVDGAQPTHSIHGHLRGATPVWNGPIVITNRSDISIVEDGKNSARKARSVNREYAKPVYSIAKSLPDTIKVTESSFKDDKIKEIVEYLCDRDSSSKNSLEVQNIIDLNIVPINIHALMREIPLVNLYNYAYTFDRLIIELYYGLQNDNARKLISELCNYGGNLGKLRSAKDALVALLINPYMDLFANGSSEDDKDSFDNTRVYDKFVRPMLSGAANNGELGRPKFLSDQIFNKAVFGQMYRTIAEYDEMGPASARDAAGNKFSLYVAAPTEIMLIAMEILNDDARFENRIIRVPFDRLALHKFCAAIMEYLNKNPDTRGAELKEFILNRFLLNDAGVEMFKRLRVSQDEDGSKSLAIYAAIIAKLVHKPTVQAIRGMVAADADSAERILNYTSSLLTLLLAMLDGVGAGTGQYMGLLTHTGAPPASLIQAGRALIRKVQNRDLFDASQPLNGIHNDLRDSFNIPGYEYNRTNIYDADEINKLVTEAVMPDTLPVRPNTNARAYIPFAWSNKRALSAITGVFNRGVLPDHEGTYLHWLDNEISTSLTSVGATLQPPPRGDNENVMDRNQIKSADVNGLKNVLADIGRLRFDTVFIRNLVFIVNLYRSVRMKLQRDLVYSRDIILKAEPVTRAQLTEFFGNQVDASNQRVYSGSPWWNRYNY